MKLKDTNLIFCVLLENFARYTLPKNLKNDENADR